MKTSVVSKVAASVPISKKSKFNLSHDVNTTYDWGSCQPLFSKLMLPDSSINVNLEQLTRLAPMVVPTFGRVKMKNYAHFIKMADIWPNWDAMMSQTKVTRSSYAQGQGPTYNTYVPKQVPCIPTSFLTAMCLAGARVNLYFSGAVGTIQENTWSCARNNGSYTTPSGWPSATQGTRAYLLGLLGIQNTQTPSLSSTLANWQNYVGPTFNVGRLLLDAAGNKLVTSSSGLTMFDLPTISTLMATPLANANGQGYTHSAGNEQNAYDLTLGDDHITFDGADLIWEYAGSTGAGILGTDRTGTTAPVAGITSNEFDGCKIRLCFKLSSFGKRLRKVLIGLGYNVNLQDNTIVSLLPLFAYYKSWWDTFAPERYRNFYETSCWQLIQLAMASTTASQFGQIYSGNQAFRGTFVKFISELGSLFATERLDAISAATDAVFGSTNSTTASNGWETDIRKTIQDTLDVVTGIDRNLATAVYDTGSSNAEWHQGAIANGNSSLNNMSLYWDNGNSEWNLTQPQLDALKKAYVVLNKASVAGMKVEEILRSQGFGAYVEECKGRFINGSDDFIKISDVVATAATSDAKLGQYGGRGLGVSDFQFSYQTNEHGILIVLSVVVPETGYVNGPARENEAYSFEHMYNPEFDGLAYEAVQKKNLGGSGVINDPTANDTFGFLPTYSQFKFMSNKANGDFSLHSMKNSLMPYSLDKYIPVNEPNVYRVEETNGHTGSTSELCSPVYHYSDLPNAGEDYRFINKFPWNGDYNRIFAAEGDGLEWSVFSPNNSAFLFNSYEFDNFMVHNVFTVSYYAHMKSIEDSYNTYDNEHGAPNTTISKC
nr:MAG: major capsid protein [Microviridae sp.]